MGGDSGCGRGGGRRFSGRAGPGGFPPRKKVRQEGPQLVSAVTDDAEENEGKKDCGEGALLWLRYRRDRASAADAGRLAGTSSTRAKHLAQPHRGLRLCRTAHGDRS